MSDLRSWQKSVSPPTLKILNCILSVLNFPWVTHICIQLWLTLCLLWLLVMSLSCAWGSCQIWNRQACDPVKQQTWWLEPLMPLITITNSITDVYKRSRQTLFILTRYDSTNMAIGFTAVKNPVLYAASLRHLFCRGPHPAAPVCARFWRPMLQLALVQGSLVRAGLGSTGAIWALCWMAVPASSKPRREPQETHSGGHERTGRRCSWSSQTGRQPNAF